MGSIFFENTKFSKNYYVERTSFQIHSNKFCSKIGKILLAIEFRRNFEISFQNYKEILVIALVNLIVQMISKAQYLQLLFIYQFHNVLPNSTL